MGPESSPGPENRSPGFARPFSHLWDRSRGPKPPKYSPNSRSTAPGGRYLSSWVMRGCAQIGVTITCIKDSLAQAPTDPCMLMLRIPSWNQGHSALGRARRSLTNSTGGAHKTDFWPRDWSGCVRTARAIHLDQFSSQMAGSGPILGLNMMLWEPATTLVGT